MVKYGWVSSGFGRKITDSASGLLRTYRNRSVLLRSGRLLVDWTATFFIEEIFASGLLSTLQERDEIGTEHVRFLELLAN